MQQQGCKLPLNPKEEEARGLGFSFSKRDWRVTSEYRGELRNIRYISSVAGPK